MNNRLVELISDELKIYKKDIIRVLDCAFKNMAIVLEEDGRINVHGFGTLQVVHKAERMGMDLNTLEKCPIPAHNTVWFKPSPILKDRVQKRGDIDKK